MPRLSIALARTRGFTLIELVVVITILGILAAFAVPRFVALQTKAREAAIQSLSGAVRSASTLTHSMWLATGQPATVPMEGATITMTNGYPDLTTIVNTLVDSSGFAYDSTTGQFTKTGATTPATCSVNYTPPGLAGQPPAIAFDISNCS
ncbi:MAG TPA: type II secretion system protein [Steroidobacteraceae bacterium]|nr:type II secretion system protein [Steroidobacteraceae bacterium]